MKRRSFISAAIGVLCAPLVSIGLMRKRVTVADYVPIAPFVAGRKRLTITGYDPTTKGVTFEHSAINEIKAVVVGKPPQWQVTITGPGFRHDFLAKTIVFPGGKGKA